MTPVPPKVQGLFSMRERYEQLLENERKVHDQVGILQGEDKKHKLSVCQVVVRCFPVVFVRSLVEV